MHREKESGEQDPQKANMLGRELSMLVSGEMLRRGVCPKPCPSHRFWQLYPGCKEIPISACDSQLEPTLGESGWLDTQVILYLKALGTCLTPHKWPEEMLFIL